MTSYQSDPALAALADPATSAAELQEIALERPELADVIAAHPNVYPDLLVWLREEAQSDGPGAGEGAGAVDPAADETRRTAVVPGMAPPGAVLAPPPPAQPWPEPAPPGPPAPAAAPGGTKARRWPWLFLGLAFGLAVGAGIGAALVIWVLPGLFGGSL
jgi:hypothetical protein